MKVTRGEFTVDEEGLLEALCKYLDIDQDDYNVELRPEIRKDQYSGNVIESIDVRISRKQGYD